jgi:ribosomal protein S18 acetylase RimI-like enzyme
MTPGDITLRPMRHDDIADGLRLCRLGGWDQVARDWEMFLDGPNAGGIVATLDERIVATAATLRFGHLFGWIGMVLVDPAVQGRGLGGMMLARAMDRITDLPSIRLDATPAGRPLYRKAGFLEECELRRMEATRVMIAESPNQPMVEPMQRDDLIAVCAIDRIVFGAPRTYLLEWLLEGAPEYAHVARVDGRVAGYVLGRRGHEFDHVGPLIADDVETAEALARACLSHRSGRGYIMDATVENDAWSLFLETVGFRQQRPYIRMYRGGTPPFGQPRRQFAVLGPEFG